MNDRERQQSVAGAVRAEMARNRKRTGELREVLGLSGPTVSGRMSGAYPFTLIELDKIATFLGITTQGILDSAAFGEGLRRNRLEGIPPLPGPPERDAWAQPARARARRATRGVDR